MKVDKLEFIRERPYGIQFDLEASPWVFTIKSVGLQIRQDGLHLPSTLRAQIPGTVLVPPVFALVNPDVGVPLQGRSSKLEVLGDFTFVGGGIDRLFKIAAEITGDVKNLTFSVEGRTILLNTLPVFVNSGVADFGKQRIELTAKTVGLIHKVIGVRSLQVLDGRAKLMRQDADLRVVGIDVAQSQIVLSGTFPNAKLPSL